MTLNLSIRPAEENDVLGSVLSDLNKKGKQGQEDSVLVAHLERMKAYRRSIKLKGPGDIDGKT